MTMQPSAELELDEIWEADHGDEVWHDASNSCHTPGGDTAESLSIQRTPAENNDGQMLKQNQSQANATISNVFGVWAATAVGMGALAVAVYYGYWSLRLQRWTAIKDFREQCQNAKTNNFSTTDCVEALSHPPIPPPVIKTLARRTYACVTFHANCSYPSASVSVPSTQDKKAWWWILLQTLVLSLTVFGLHWLGTISPATGRSFIQRHFGARGFAFLRFLRRLAWEILVLLTCFSPLYALWFWYLSRKRIAIFSIAGLTCIGGAFTACYVYGSRTATWSAQSGIDEDDGVWRMDLQSLEQGVRTRSGGSAGDDLLGLDSGRRRHR